MARKVSVLLLAALLAQGIAGAQDTSMALPNGSFEQWTTQQGYSLDGLIPLPVYNSFSVPSGWDYLSYPVDETFTLGFQTFAVNTLLPLIVAAQETVTVPHGTSAVKLQTFMLDDIINPAVYFLAEDYLDTSLTNTVYPSILATGQVDILHFIPLLNSLMADMDSLPALMAMLADADVNYFVTGGIALGDFVPSRLTGHYRYHSALGSGDNGGVLMLGTRYNSALGRREAVGGGVNISLTDCEGYTPFSVEYTPLHAYDASYPELEPDSLIVMLVSSASLNRQQGSYLCIDSLTLWHLEPPAPDTTVIPDLPDTTSVPDTTYIPDQPDTTSVPDTTYIPDQPDTTSVPDTTYIPDQPDTTSVPDTTYIPDEPDTTSINAVQSPALRLSVTPNPARGWCQVILSEPEGVELRLYTADGRLLRTLRNCPPRVTLALPRPGVYLLQALSPRGTTLQRIVNLRP